MSLEEFPEHRREAMLWRYALELDYAGVEDLVVTSVDQPCPLRWCSDATRWRAVLGNDGRYHLRDDKGPMCGDGWTRFRVDPDGRLVHEQQCTWWSYRSRSAWRVPREDPANGRGYRFRTVRWTVQLGRTTAWPEVIPYGRRCPASSSSWPAFHDPATRMGRIRIQLAAEFGRYCHACRRGPAFAVDHDHVTGLVRGLLCRICNSHIDHCPHLTGCPYADYLNNPPATQLALTFPQPRGNKPTPMDLLRIEYLGINPFQR